MGMYIMRIGYGHTRTCIRLQAPLTFLRRAKSARFSRMVLTESKEMITYESKARRRSVFTACVCVCACVCEWERPRRAPPDEETKHKEALLLSKLVVGELLDEAHARTDAVGTVLH